MSERKTVPLKVIQQIPLEGYSIYLRGINWDTNRIYINGNPALLKREETFMVDDGKVITKSYFFPIEWLQKFLSENDAINEDGSVCNVNDLIEIHGI